MIKEIYSTREKEISLNIVQTEVDAVRKKDITKTGIRIYKDDCLGIAGAIGNYDEKKLTQKAIEALDQKIPYPYDVSKNNKIHLDNTKNLISEEDFVKEINEVLAELKISQPDFIFSHKASISEITTSLKNDVGLDLLSKERYFGTYFTFKTKSSINVFDGGAGFGGREYNKEALLNEINNMCNAYNNLLDFPEDKNMPIIFSSNDHIIFSFLESELSGLKYGTNSSVFSGKVGEKIFSENFTLIQSQDPAESHSDFFDSEGLVNPNYRYTLIENGILKSPYTDKKTAATYNLPQTGSASSSYDGIPQLSNKSFLPLSSNKTLKKLLKGKPGIYVNMAYGGDYTPEGDFATPIQLAYLFDGEKFVGRLPEMQVKSNIYDMFGKNYIGTSSDSLNPCTLAKSIVFKMDYSKM